MDLPALEISPRILGPADTGPLVHAFVRPLRPEDLPLLNAPRPPVKPEGTALKRLGNRHHALARHLAGGMKPEEAAHVTTYAIATVRVLLTNPAFQELIEFYRTDIQREARSNFERLAGLSADAADELQTRLEEEPEKLSVGQLIEVIKMGADRTGNGPQSSNVTLNINANLADRMKAAREAARAASQPVTIEGTVLETRESNE
jgi:hypothetical protein